MTIFPKLRTSDQLHNFASAFLMAIVCLVAIHVLPAFAKESPQDRIQMRYKKELLGREISRETYPQGWTLQRLGGRVAVGEVGGPYQLTKNGWTAYAYQKVLEQRPDGKFLIRSQIVDVVLFKHGPRVDTTVLCKYADGRQPDIQVAAVNFGRCERYSKRVQKAWRWDDKTNAVVMADLTGLTCEMVAFGQEPDTRKCIDWEKCYRHFNLSQTSAPDFEQRSYCSDRFLLTHSNRSTR